MAKTLLVTDDAAIVREKIKEAARGAGWEIVGEARNGKEAVERYAELRPMAMTIDLVMPEYDGIYALREIIALDPERQDRRRQRARTEEHPERRVQARRDRLHRKAVRQAHADQHARAVRQRRGRAATGCRRGVESDASGCKSRAETNRRRLGWG